MRVVRRFSRWCFLNLLLSLMLQSCISVDEVRPFEESLKTDYVQIKEEVWAIEQGDRMHADMQNKGLIYRDAEVQTYINSIERRLLSSHSDYEAAMQVFVIRSPLPNAMALPNNVIYINSGLFTLLDSEDQLAGIVAHEIAHITERHAIKAVISNKKTWVSAHVADFMTGGFGLAYLPAMASIMQYSREAESEADKVGLKQLSQAGYDPNSYPEVFLKFQQIPDTKYVKNSVYSSHPSSQQRIEDLQAQIATMPETPYSVEDTSETFLRIKARLMEDNVNMRIKARQFHLALNVLQAAETYYQNNARIAYYTGEVYRGMAKYPVDAAQEQYWIETGKISRNNQYVEEFIQAQQDNLIKAEQAYLSALDGEEIYNAAYRALAEVKIEQGDDSAAIQFFNRYLQLEPQSPYRRYIEKKIKQLQQKP